MTKTTRPPKMGRPPKPQGEARSMRISVAISPQDYNAIMQAIEAMGGTMTVSEFVRSAAATNARIVRSRSMLMNAAKDKADS